MVLQLNNLQVSLGPWPGPVACFCPFNNKFVYIVPGCPHSGHHGHDSAKALNKRANLHVLEYTWQSQPGAKELGSTASVLLFRSGNTWPC